MLEGVIDLRSDTLTHPTEAMREAMARARVGDDGYGEDPTVNRLEEMAAERMGKEAGLFTPSGTMGNLLAVMSHTRHGDEVVLESRAHIYESEVAGLTAVAGCIPRLVEGVHGVLSPDPLQRALRLPSLGNPPTTLLCIENTHNSAGGTLWTPEQTRLAADWAHAHGLHVHLDGARIFNAAVAQGVHPIVLTRDVDSVQFCLSKGLSAPVGSVLTGSKEFIARARKARRMIGGAMRQAGVIAAAGIVALETMVDRLAEDHAHARLLAEGLTHIPGVFVDLPTVQTNMVFPDVADLGLTAQQFSAELAKRNVRAAPRLPSRVRMVLNRHITREDVYAVIDAVRDIAESVR